MGFAPSRDLASLCLRHCSTCVPSRDRTICLCFGLSATLEETQELLKRNGFAQLYVRNRRDAIIIYGLSHSMELAEINDRLFAEEEATLC